LWPNLALNSIEIVAWTQSIRMTCGGRQGQRPADNPQATEDRAAATQT
jgi:hypothetical protein